MKQQVGELLSLHRFQSLIMGFEAFFHDVSLVLSIESILLLKGVTKYSWNLNDNPKLF